MSEEQSYDELYDKGFNEQDTTVDNTEEDSTEETLDDATVEEEIVKEEVDESLEQPTGEETKEETEETSTSEEETDTTEETKSDSVEEETYSITIGGQEITLSLEEMKQFAQKGGDYTRKTQDLAKNRADIELMNEKGLSHEDLVILADIKAGNKEALAVLARQANIDPLDVEENPTYEPKVEQRNFELEDVISDIKNDANNLGTIDGWLSVLPDATKKSFADNPAILKGLHADTVNGISKDIMPEVIKALAFNPNADFLATYQAIGQAVVNSKAVEEPEAKAEVKPQASREDKLKATANKSRPKNTHLKDHQDVWEDNDLYESMKKQLAEMK